MADKQNNNFSEDLDDDIDIMMRRRREGGGQESSPAVSAHPAGDARVYERSSARSAGQRPATPRNTPGQGTPQGTVRSQDSVQRSPGKVASQNAQNRPVQRVREDIVSKKINVNDALPEDNTATRKTDIGDKYKTASKKKAKKKETPAEIGSSLVTGMMRTVIYIVVVAVIASVISIFVVNVANDVYAFVKSDEIIDVTIPEGATPEVIADILYENGVIRYKAIFKFYGEHKHYDEVTFVPGDYTVTPMMNYKELYSEFREKPVSGTSRITIPEGYTVDEIIDLMLSYGIGGTKEDYVDAINNYDYDYWFVDELEANGMSNDRFYRLEGYLFPDTYEFYNASSAVTVVDRLLQRFNQVYLNGYKERAEELNLTTDQVVTLASMIEKEAGMSTDYRNVSSVFHNRLNNPSSFPRLESDATVVYAVHHLTGERPTDVTGETISFESPYNTYQAAGLPPSAIANPGINAIKYALYPADTSYYYFVSSKDGLTLFATNLAGHEANKASIGLG